MFMRNGRKGDWLVLTSLTDSLYLIILSSETLLARWTITISKHLPFSHHQIFVVPSTHGTFPLWISYNSKCQHPLEAFGHCPWNKSCFPCFLPLVPETICQNYRTRQSASLQIFINFLFGTPHTETCDTMPVPISHPEASWPCISNKAWYWRLKRCCRDMRSCYLLASWFWS